MREAENIFSASERGWTVSKILPGMSRVGKKPIMIPAGIEATLSGRELKIKGPKGDLFLELHPNINAVISSDDGAKKIEISLKELRNKKDQALWGLYGSLVRNMIRGVKDNWVKELELVGVGFKVALKGSALLLDLGFSHPVDFPLPKGILAKVEKNVITLSGVDKQLVGEVAARIRSLKPPEPYKGKGIKYVNEIIIRKAGKAAKAGTAAK